MDGLGRGRKIDEWNGREMEQGRNKRMGRWMDKTEERNSDRWMSERVEE